MTLPQNTPSFTILDYSEVRSTQLEILSFDIVGFVGYAALLYIYCVLFDGFVCTLVLLLTQLVIGIITTRVHFSLGMKTRHKIRLKEPSSIESGWELERAELKLEDIRKLIEHAYTQISEQNPTKIDDYNDLAWFTILIWSVFSSVAVNFLHINPRFCITGALLTGFICMLVYINGYQSSNLNHLCDHLDHLEFFSQSRLSKLDQVLHVDQKKMFVEWLSKSGKFVLNDFGCILRINQNCNGSCDIAYNLGFPSHRNERFLIKGKWDSGSEIPLNLKESFSKGKWNIKVEFSEVYTLIHVEKMVSEDSIETANISNINIDKVEQSSNEILEVLKKILNICSMS